MSSIGPKRYDAFLSYNSQDRPAVEELAERLKGEGLALYLEEWELAPGREFQPALAEALRDSKTCVVFLGPNGLGPWQKRGAPGRHRQAGTRPRLPRHPGAAPRRPSGLGGGTWRTWSSSSTPRGSSSSRRSTTSGPSGSLVWGITGTKPARRRTSRYEGVCPYRGLEAFGPDDAKFFFGRENLTDWLVSDLRREVRAAQGVRFLAVLGPSGSGKSSVVLAGSGAAADGGGDRRERAAGRSRSCGRGTIR